MIIPTLDQSGAEKQFCLLAEGIQKAGIDLEVIALTRGGPFEERLNAVGIPLTILQKRFRFDVSALWKLRSLIKQKRPDFVLSYLFAGNAYTRLALLGAWKNRPKVLISERCVDSWKSRWQLTLDRLLRPQTDFLIANSQSVAEFYQSIGFPAEKLRVIPNGVERPLSPDFTKEELCAQIGLPLKSRLVAFVGRLAPQKRLKDLLWAIQMLRLSHPDTYLLLIGTGPMKTELQEYARTTEASSNTRFLGHREDAGALLNLVDAFWLASEFEGMSNSLMEAMACGKPVVVSDIPPNRELVEHNVTGWIVSLGDSAGWTQYTARLLDDPELAKSIGESARKSMEEKFKLQSMIDQTLSLINECKFSGAISDSQSH